MSSPKRSNSVSTLPQLYPSSLPRKEGWIKKDTNKFFNKWPTRYLILENQCLYCFSSITQSKFLGGINFSKLSISTISFPKRREIHLVPLSSSGRVKLRFSSSSDFKDWEEALNSHISTSRGKQKALIDYPLWTLNRISAKEFSLLGETGDIILFKSKNIVGSMQRVFSLSDYDHVALVYKYPSGELAFLESTKDNGVDLCYWDDFLAYDWESCYYKLAYRKLEIDQKDKVNEKIDLFIRSVLGKKFGIGAKKIFSRFTGWQAGDERFFCSELVARAYQEIGILNGEKSASSYWPGDFSERGRTSFTGAKLLLEQVIDFRIIQSVLMK